MSTTETKNSQIVSTLCRKTLSFDTLLSRLQTRYPTDNWTSATLTGYLQKALQQGRVWLSVGGYQVNPQMALLNIQNEIYYKSCGIYPTPCPGMQGGSNC